MEIFDAHHIAGRWAPSPAVLDVVNPATEEVIGRVPAGSPEDVDRAVAAAAAAFPGWSSTLPAERAEHLRRLAAELELEAERLAAVITAELGMPRALALRVQLGLPRRVLASMPELLLGLPAEEQIGATRVVREPVGVVGCITPWNYPLHQIVAKVAPALAAGCTTVLKPSEVTPLCAFHFARLVERAGLPPGVFNLVSGVGPVVGEALAAHPGVDMISFTGSTQAGRRVAALAAATVKRVALELGGKSANVILDDADFDAAVASGVERCFPNSGQTCSAWTRMLVPRARLEEANRIAKATAETFTVGDPETDVRLGPLVSARQRDRVRAHVRGALEQGATLLCGGPDAPEGLPRGFFFRPTVFTNVRPTMTIAQEEVFGPVLAILPYEDEDDAVELANGTIYGLAAAVWSRHPDRARRVASRLRAGQVYINGGAFNPIAPFGGFKQSGLGRELGRHGLEEFFELKALQYPEGT